MKNNKLFRWLGSALGIIVLGAIGSGLWAEFLSPGWNWFIDKIIRFVSKLSLSFKTQIYKSAAEGFHEEHSLTLLVLFLVALASFYVGILIMRYLLRFDSPKEKVRSFIGTHKEFVFFNFLTLVVIVTLSISVMQVTYSNKITTKTLNSIEILSPFIHRREKLLLTSEFLRIKNPEDYEKLYMKLKDLSEQHKIELSLFEPL